MDKTSGLYHFIQENNQHYIEYRKNIRLFDYIFVFLRFFIGALERTASMVLLY